MSLEAHSPTIPPGPASGRIARAQQLGLDLCSQSLRDVTFCVVDLETTGGSPTDGRITEMGAVKVRAGEVIGEFQSFVNPQCSIPAFITVLTGITDGMVVNAPTEHAAVPMLLEFMAGSVFVAHNAPYDTGFLKAACRRLELAWSNPVVVDTARVARSTMTRDEVPNHKLSTLAMFFRTSVRPTHRALDDARATVDVLHGLIERLGCLGVTTLEDLLSCARKVPESRRRKRHLADRLPEKQGVYVFRDSEGTALYVGVSANIRKRVGSYFTAAEQRSRMNEMVGITASVSAIVCETDLEAQVRELRLIAELKPNYNRRSRWPEKQSWLKLTTEAFPRLSIVRRVAQDEHKGAAYIGPFRGRRDAEAAREALVEAFGVRPCTTTLRPGRAGPSCILAQIGRCLAPCLGQIQESDYQPVSLATHAAMLTPSVAVQAAITQRLHLLSRAERFEDAAAWRDRLQHYQRGTTEAAATRGLGQVPEIVAVAQFESSWDIHVIRYGRLAGSRRIGSDANGMAVVRALRETAEDVLTPHPPLTAALPAETRLIRSWLEQARLLSVDGRWASDWKAPASHVIDLRTRDLG